MASHALNAAKTRWVSTVSPRTAPPSRRRMADNPRYHLIELRSQHGWAQLETLAEDARALAAELRAEGLQLRYLRTISVPADETCFHLFEGTEEALAEASSRVPDTYREERR